MKKQTAFKRWADFVKDEKTTINRAPSSFRFIARFRLASKFDGVKADGYGEKTLRGYDALLKVFLAYTAFESLIEAIDENRAIGNKHLAVDFSIDKHNHSFDDFSISRKIWNNEKLLQILIDYADVSQRTSVQMEALMSFYLGVIDGKHLHAVARQIRHLVAHGNLTAYGAESIRKENTDALGELAKLILDETYNLFEQYVSKIEAQAAISTK
ncbi:MAG: hypothetical protein B7Y59_03935 [Burkholderiales bacterium 35-55-47]|jgi:hypothetical protein|uniref:hypothetical protein n=1 Tax=Limnohabitans sp. TaxID=1907725 RepID=UPI000BC82CAD|nr:hypothetical protein [Limnohabitans sp.]OYY20240.1 MAG: hypothetical protein B7Y59_03935 [Burkholderiales bacterium 35-55-47]OYZ74148.1 MAG: hypothetical protein B7Y06_01080 [Burkholderiales bacterium 24-55-52]OZB01960.1 MAG: hypothetical protein B7X62_03925 [Burkholderiales bacterium 39-55-53]HQR86490.1 hypothetical protein [Limnohabitans sp.]HQS28093.1 hypothetical protein [Limnohabitans sp.]